MYSLAVPSLTIPNPHPADDNTATDDELERLHDVIANRRDWLMIHRADIMAVSPRRFHLLEKCLYDVKISAICRYLHSIIQPRRAALIELVFQINSLYTLHFENVHTIYDGLPAVNNNPPSRRLDSAHTCHTPPPIFRQRTH